MDLDHSTPVSFQDRLVPAGARLAGWAALVHGLGLGAPVRAPSAVAHGHIRGSRRTDAGWTVFDKRYWPGTSVTDHLAFALRHEPIDLLILKRASDTIPAGAMAEFIRAAPTGASARRAWFFREALTGKTLDLEDAEMVTAVDALDPTAYFASAPLLSKRHRVRDNLLGTAEFCPVIRRTGALGKWIGRDLALKAAELTGRTGRHLIARAASFLLLADSRASFEIEGERPPRNRLERWGRAVLQAGRNPLSLDELNRLHGVLIEDTRFVKAGLRSEGVFIGERTRDGEPLPEFIGARPDDLARLVAGLLAANERMRASELDPVLQAAATAFGFVNIHPFEDGNGRLHRCLIHHVLGERGFTPPGLVLPVSSVMLDRIDGYRRALQEHSSPLMDFIDWRPTPRQNVEVTNDTADLYRYFDCTAEAEFLYECVARAVEHDLPSEIDFLRRQDEAQRRILEIVDMPDHLAQKLLLFMRQNEGKIPKRRRQDEFAALTDEEAERIEAVYREVFVLG
jgi:Fic family protein